MAQAQGLADVALGERAAVDQQVAVNARHRGGHVPGGAHVTPGVGEGDAHILGGGGVGREVVSRPVVDGHRGTIAGRVRDVTSAWLE